MKKLEYRLAVLNDDIERKEEKLKELGDAVYSADYSYKKKMKENARLIETAFVKGIQNTKREIEKGIKLKEKNMVLFYQKQELEKQVYLLHGLLRDIRNKVEKDTLRDSVSKEITQELDSIVSSIDSKTREFVFLSSKINELDEGISMLSIEEKKLVEENKSLKHQSSEYVQKIIELQQKQQELAETIKKIEKREQASKVMLFRTRDEYLKYYKSRPYKKELEY